MRPGFGSNRRRGRKVALGGENLGRSALGAAQLTFLVGFVGFRREPEAGEGVFKSGGDPAADAHRRNQAHALFLGGLLRPGA